MGWSIGYDSRWKRDIGYGVPAMCDQPGCGSEIDRGLSYVCGTEPFGGEHGCGLYFCGEHLFRGKLVDPITGELVPEDVFDGPVDWNTIEYVDLCQPCYDEQPPFAPTPDVPEWTEHKRTDPSWQEWRDSNQDD